MAAELEEHDRTRIAATDLWEWNVETTTVMLAQLILHLSWKVRLRPGDPQRPARGSEVCCVHRRVRHLNLSLYWKLLAARMAVWEGELTVA